MQESFTKVGGARIGWINFTWPFARLSVTQDKLTIRVMFDAYTFAPTDVYAIERYKGYLSEGIRICHNVASYPERIIFWSNPEKALNCIWDAGFAVSAR
jgi:hypothetical protein